MIEIANGAPVPDQGEALLIQRQLCQQRTCVANYDRAWKCTGVVRATPLGGS
jgi:hypothetical protein